MVVVFLLLLIFSCDNKDFLSRPWSRVRTIEINTNDDGSYVLFKGEVIFFNGVSNYGFGWSTQKNAFLNFNQNSFGGKSEVGAFELKVSKTMFTKNVKYYGKAYLISGAYQVLGEEIEFTVQ